MSDKLKLIIPEEILASLSPETRDFMEKLKKALENLPVESFEESMIQLERGDITEIRLSGDMTIDHAERLSFRTDERDDRE